MILNCADEATAAKWLSENAGPLSPWEEVKLKTVEKKDLPKAIIVTFLVDSVEDKSERILKLMKSQNNGLSITDYRILRKTQGKDDLPHDVNKLPLPTSRKMAAKPVLNLVK